MPPTADVTSATPPAPSPLSPSPLPPSLPWTLLLDPVGRPGSENMALDESLLFEADRTGASFLRLYRWTPPCLSFGRNEPALARYDRAGLERLGLDVVRRPTGGRAVWHEHEVTYAVAAPIAAFGSLRGSYRAIHELLARALLSLGVDATLASDGPTVRPRPSGSPLGPDGPGPCFAVAVGGEVVVNGKKVIGSAQVRQGRAFLQHGSILVAGSQDQVSALSRRSQAGTAGGATTLSAALGRPIAFAEVAAAVVGSWNAELCPAVPPSAESFRVRLSHFADPSWTWRR